MRFFGGEGSLISPVGRGSIALRAVDCQLLLPNLKCSIYFLCSAVLFTTQISRINKTAVEHKVQYKQATVNRPCRSFLVTPDRIDNTPQRSSQLHNPSYESGDRACLPSALAQ